MTKVKFFYCTGTSYMFSLLETGYNLSLAPPSDAVVYVKGLRDEVYPWPEGIPNDPFPNMLDKSIWEPKKISYAAASFNLLNQTTGTILGGMGSSITDGVIKVSNQIKQMTPGQPFAVGGTSQGAAVMSSIYNELRYGSLTSYYPGFLGGVCFGNPRRQVNFRGEIGGTWSGAWDVPGSTTGGHGSFPTTGDYARLTNSEGTEWLEFAYPDDIFTSTGDSTTGTLWTQGNDTLLDLNYSDFFGKLAGEIINAILILPGLLIPAEMTAAINTAFNLGGGLNYIVDALGNLVTMPGAGHVLQSALPPPNTDGTIPAIERTETVYETIRGLPSKYKVPVTRTYLEPDGLTSYQLALAWLEAKAQEWATAPVIVPSTGSVGWSTTLVPPAQ